MCNSVIVKKKSMQVLLQMYEHACHGKSWGSVWVLSQMCNACLKEKCESVSVFICSWSASTPTYTTILGDVKGDLTLLTFIVSLEFEIFIFIFDTWKYFPLQALCISTFKIRECRDSSQARLQGCCIIWNCQSCSNLWIN